MSGRQLGIALIGAGRMGQILLRSLQAVPEARLIRICDENEAVAGQSASLAGVTGGSSVSTVLEDPQVEAVIISTPTATHARLTIEAVRAGKAVFVEKPVAHSLAAADEVIQVVEHAGAHVQVGFQRRFDPAYLEAKRKITAGELGKVEGYRGVGRDAYPPSTRFLLGSGGIFVDMGIHDLDSARFFAGEVSEIYATGGAISNPHLASYGLHDSAVATLRFVTGALGTLELALNAPWGYDIRTEIIGSAGRISIEMDSRYHLKHYGPAGVACERPPDFEVRFREAYVNELRAFACGVLNGTQASPGVRDARESLRLALAAQKSLETGEVIRLP
jgi:myo-inositol 2-dehydrogenase/D-chiro-inositol 1-dehydrogenase/scyllo-inositol 2-dehydrogenase (NAD+)